MLQRDELADHLEQRGTSNGERPAQVWLTEAERTEIVAALRGEPETHLRCCGTVEPKYNCIETVQQETKQCTDDALERAAQVADQEYGQKPIVAPLTNAAYDEAARTIATNIRALKGNC